jgi:hypothetical protein
MRRRPAQMAGLLSDLAPSTYPNLVPPNRPSKPKMDHGTWTLLITFGTLSRSWRMIAKTGTRITWTNLQRMLEMTETGFLETLNTMRPCHWCLPAIQNINLACRALGLGTVITTNHILYEGEAAGRCLYLCPDAHGLLGRELWSTISSPSLADRLCRSMGRTMDGSQFNGEVAPRFLPLTLAAGILPLCRKSCRHSRQRG